MTSETTSMVNGALTAPSLARNPVSRRLSICFAIVAGMAAALLNLKELPLFTESIEQRLVFDPIPADSKMLRSIPLAYDVQEVRLTMPDGVILQAGCGAPSGCTRASAIRW